MSNELNLKISAETTDSQEKEEAKFKEWEIEDAARCLIRAEEIKQDTELMALVAPKLQKQVKAATNIAKVLFGNNQDKEGK